MKCRFVGYQEILRIFSEPLEIAKIAEHAAGGRISVHSLPLMVDLTSLHHSFFDRDCICLSPQKLCFEYYPDLQNQDEG